MSNCSFTIRFDEKITHHARNIRAIRRRYWSLHDIRPANSGQHVFLHRCEHVGCKSRSFLLYRLAIFGEFHGNEAQGIDEFDLEHVKG